MAERDEEIKKILEESKVIAMVGLSPDVIKPSNTVGRYLQGAGYRIIPVSPLYNEVLGEKCYKSLLDIPGKVDIVDIFMRSEKLLPVVEEAIQIAPRCIWLQLGIVNNEAEELAKQNAIPFFMDLCLKLEYGRLLKSSS